MPLLDCIDQISKYTMCTCCGKPAGLFSHMLFDIEKELFLLQLSGENSVLASLSRRPEQPPVFFLPHQNLAKSHHLSSGAKDSKSLKYINTDIREQNIYDYD